MARGNTWTNSDGLVVGFGTHSLDDNVGAVTQGANGIVTIRKEIELADLVDTYAAANTPPQEVTIPRGSTILRAVIQTVEAAVSSGGGTLDLGTWTKGKATDVVDDADGIVADVTVAEMTSLGEVHICDGALVGASGATAVGTIGDGDCVIAPSYETAAFQSGKVILTVEYLPPTGSAGRTIAA